MPKLPTSFHALTDCALAIDGARRCYKIDDEHAAVVIVDVQSDGKLYVRVVGRNRSHYVTLAELSSSACFGFAEVLRLVEDWKAGKLDELPPSNAPALVNDDDDDDDDE